LTNYGFGLSGWPYWEKAPGYIVVKGNKRLQLDQPASNHIRVQGIFPARWRDYIQGMDIRVEGNEECPVTMLTGRLLDQAALYGILNFLYDQRLPLLSVECLSF
jgi:hypothetical protein